MVVFRSIMEGLASKGHTVHVLSHYPRETTLANYTDLSVAGSMPLLINTAPFELFDTSKFDIFNINEVVIAHTAMHEHGNVMKLEAVQKLLTSNERYDLIVTEPFATDAFLGFVHKFKVPFVFLSSYSAPHWVSAVMANPQNPAFVPLAVTSSIVSPKMTFFERFTNTFRLLSKLMLWYWFFVPVNQKMMNKHFGDDMPPLLDIYKNVSLMLTNTHPAITGGRPLAPNVIDVGGVHIRPAKKLPNDIEKFIEESPYGVVYFSMGSVLRAASLPKEKKDALVYTFSKLKERVLWKFEDEDISVPDNILIKNWMPQRDILAHPKVKLFISHGGILGILEAISEGKPIVGIPMFTDQGTNIRALELQEVAKLIDYYTMDNETVYEAVQEMLKPRYSENAKELSRLFHDRPMSPIDTAAYWIEYVIRNNGAKILRSPAVDLPYYQYLLIDVFLFFVLCLIAFIFAINYFVKMLLCRIRELKNVRKKHKSQ